MNQELRIKKRMNLESRILNFEPIPASSYYVPNSNLQLANCQLLPSTCKLATQPFPQFAKPQPLGKPQKGCAPAACQFAGGWL